VYVIAVVVQFCCTLLSPLVTIKPTFSPMRVALAGTHHYYSCDRAKRELGYKPVVDMDEAIARTLEHFKDLRNTEL